MKDARDIVLEIVREIEKRVYAAPFDDSLLKRFQHKIQDIETSVGREFSQGIPERHIAEIRAIMGEEFMECLDRGKPGPLVWKGRDRLRRTYRKLAALLEFYRYYKKEAQRGALEVACLKAIQQELIESQISHVHETETLDRQLSSRQLLVALVLEPFETAMKKAMAFLKAKQLEVFLFDDDRFLATELKIDGETFLYNTEEEVSSLPESVSELTFQEVQETSLEVPLIAEGQQIGHYRVIRQIADGFDRDAWTDDVESLTPVLARIIESHKNRLLARKVYIDDLTGLYNKRKLNEQMGKLFKQFKRGEKKLHLAMMDVDRFKVLNDTYGHPVGDHILRQTALLIKQEVPYAYRYGGEEFAGVFYGYDRSRTMTILQNLCKMIEDKPFVIGGREYHITISAGVAAFETHMNSVMDAIDRADQALYASKEDGRNRCTYYDDVKDRLSDDAARLRQEVRRLKEQVTRMKDLEHENRILSEQIAARKPARKKRGVN